jgi:undecaprenyl-diphosphatase
MEPGVDVARVAPSRRVLPPQVWWSRFVILGVMLLTCGSVVTLLVLRNKQTMNANDLGLNTRIHDFGLAHPFLRELSRAVSWLGSGSHTVPTVIAFLVVLLALRKWRWFVFLAASAELGLLISRLLKAGVGRSRPPWVTFSGPELGTSFPSGHTFSGITSWVAMGIVVLFVLRRPWSTILASALITVGVLNGPSRLILGQHWVTDVLGSLLLATGWLLIVSGVCLRFWGRPPASEGVTIGAEGAPTQEGSGGGAASMGEVGPPQTS